VPQVPCCAVLWIILCCLQGERVVSEFVSHLALNPHQEVPHGTQQQQQKQGAVTISTIHASKVGAVQGMMYGMMSNSSRQQQKQGAVTISTIYASKVGATHVHFWTVQRGLCGAGVWILCS
jgi:hypothetical protein